MAKDSLDKKNISPEQQHEIADTAAVPLTPDATVAPLPAPIATTDVAEQVAPSERRQVVKSASLVMLGNLGSSVMGMVRQIVVAATGSATAGWCCCAAPRTRQPSTSWPTPGGSASAQTPTTATA